MKIYDDLYINSKISIRAYFLLAIKSEASVFMKFQFQLYKEINNITKKCSRGKLKIEPKIDENKL